MVAGVKTFAVDPGVDGNKNDLSFADIAKSVAEANRFIQDNRYYRVAPIRLAINDNVYGAIAGDDVLKAGVSKKDFYRYRKNGFTWDSDALIGYLATENKTIDLNKLPLKLELHLSADHKRNFYPLSWQIDSYNANSQNEAYALNQIESAFSSYLFHARIKGTGKQVGSKTLRNFYNGFDLFEGSSYQPVWRVKNRAEFRKLMKSALDGVGLEERILDRALGSGRPLLVDLKRIPDLDARLDEAYDKFVLNGEPCNKAGIVDEALLTAVFLDVTLGENSYHNLKTDEKTQQRYFQNDQLAKINQYLNPEGKTYKEFNEKAVMDKFRSLVKERYRQ